MTTIIRLVVVAALAGMSITANAGFKTGNTLLDLCDTKTEVSDGACIGYIMGIVDVMTNNNPVNGNKACLAREVGAGEFVDIALKYMRANAAMRHRGAAELVAEALQRAFPCYR
jgi:hypothetical protein